MPGAYMGKILRVDLTTGKIGEEELPGEDVLRKYLGCYALGLRYLYDEVPPGIGSFDAENPLIFMTGPFVGTSVPTSNATTLTMKNMDTGFTAGRSHSHGWFGPNLKFNGYDGLIITGKAENPVYLWLHEGKIEIKNASHLWGKDTHETEDLVKEELGAIKASVAAIGPAGENLCAGALIENDRNHSFSHSGGTLMGSKKLKAIAVFGRNKVPVVDERRLGEAARRWKDKILKGPITDALGRGGIARGDYSLGQRQWGVGSRNFRKPFPEFGQGMSKNKITARPCYRCPIGCSYDIEILSGHHRGYVATLSGGGEALEASAGIFGIGDAGDIFYLTDLLDRLGIEGGSFGFAAAMAFEAYEKGLISKEDTDGLELRWGDPKIVEKIMRKYAYREGFGDILAQGAKVAAEIIGQGVPDFAINVKGSPIPLHDWRNQWGRMLSFITSTGSGHAGRTPDTYPQPDLGYPEKMPGLTPKGKAEQLKGANMLEFVVSSVGICLFATLGIHVMDDMAQALSGATGWDFTKDELFQIGERAVNLERAFNVRHGLTPYDDYNVPARLIDEPEEGLLGRGKALRDYLRGMVGEYYKLMGWDEKSGKPWRSTLKKLGLEDVIKDLWG